MEDVKEFDEELDNKIEGRAHDKFAREIFSDIKLLREFLQQHIPQDILSRVDLNYLKVMLIWCLLC